MQPRDPVTGRFIRAEDSKAIKRIEELGAFPDPRPPFEDLENEYTLSSVLVFLAILLLLFAVVVMAKTGHFR